MLISYVLDAGKGGHGMDDLSERCLGHKTIHFDEVAGTRQGEVTFDCVAVDKATDYAAEDADVTLRLWNALKPRMTAEHVTTVYETLERPLMPVLARMERRGISIDRADALAALGRIRAEAGARSKRRSRSLPASRSIPALPSSSATSCSAS